MALENVRTVEMGGPLMLADDLGNLRAAYERNRITLPVGAGLGIEVDEQKLAHYAEGQARIGN
jgi:muconate cycloisomerase